MTLLAHKLDLHQSLDFWLGYPQQGGARTLGGAAKSILQLASCGIASPSVFALVFAPATSLLGPAKHLNAASCIQRLSALMARGVLVNCGSASGLAVLYNMRVTPSQRTTPRTL
ncbi:MAG: hypothetical protein TH68_04030 [Candidatus Synechococcus spongiarum 142]|uniref:Uncharacterized protein n=1 Tax=Candidatus Synechococcus spongiarum 142 TaxID=1608213 RepID=A0A6N3X8X6_9SYNE|nr:MAG: hypothetical protein TH68_04030 [Candidatus Synechococcus spongiarum 142]